jgi:hypothetical protein
MADSKQQPGGTSDEVKRLIQKKFQIIQNIQNLRLELTKVSEEMHRAGAPTDITVMCF